MDETLCPYRRLAVDGPAPPGGPTVLQLLECLAALVGIIAFATWLLDMDRTTGLLAFLGAVAVVMAWRVSGWHRIVAIMVVVACWIGGLINHVLAKPHDARRYDQPTDSRPATREALLIPLATPGRFTVSSRRHRWVVLDNMRIQRLDQDDRPVGKEIFLGRKRDLIPGTRRDQIIGASICGRVLDVSTRLGFVVSMSLKTETVLTRYRYASRGGDIACSPWRVYLAWSDREARQAYVLKADPVHFKQRVGRLRLGARADHLALRGHRLAVTDSHDNRLYIVNTKRWKWHRIDVRTHPSFVALGRGVAWVTVRTPKPCLTQVDLSSDETTATWPLAEPPVALTTNSTQLATVDSRGSLMQLSLDGVHSIRWLRLAVGRPGVSSLELDHDGMVAATTSGLRVATNRRLDGLAVPKPNLPGCT